ncbi:glyceraldehyde 3-phosphate dehydrogenase [Angomonas deanei]|nr:glyceraldehyde 3-phosphate dehydrogenase [Angomonas deanei]|eukprot:EPY35986.1 glyceraldehyde 3-phosphate dehydrogenase [Angomonas deanei]
MWSTWPTCSSTTAPTAASRAPWRRTRPRMSSSSMESTSASPASATPRRSSGMPSRWRWWWSPPVSSSPTSWLASTSRLAPSASSYRAPEGRHPHVRDGRQPHHLRRSGYDQQCQLHHQLPRPPRQGAPRKLWHRGGSHDHRARHHRHPEDRRRSLREGLAWWSRCLPEHYPQQHRRRQGRGQGDPGAQREAHRHVPPCPYPQRECC